LPVASVLTPTFSAGGTGATWSHLADTVLAGVRSNTLLLCFGVGLRGDRRRRGHGLADDDARVSRTALLRVGAGLPLAMPAYVLAYVYTDFLQFVGPLQSWLRETFGWRAAITGFPTCAAWAARWRCSFSSSIRMFT
jgi:iron(III) transport system permease protein